MNYRTALITAGSLAAVIIAGASAVAASLGILDASASDDVGNLSAATSATATTTTAPDAGNSVVYAVADAGLVKISRTDSGLVVDDVTPEPGWSWTASAPGDTVVVDLVSPSIGHRLSVTTRGDALLPVVTDLAIGSPRPASTVPYDDDHDDDHDDDDHDDDHHDDDDDHNDDDDDHEEYEGRDWDD